VEESVALLYDALLRGTSLGAAVDSVTGKFESIAVNRHRRPKVAIFGDLYVRDNDVLNQDLIRTIERHGGEVVTTPYSDLVKIVADVYIKKWFMIGKHADAIFSKAMSVAVPMLTERYEKKFRRLLPPPARNVKRAPEEILKMFNLEVFLTGESMENILKLFHLVDAHEDLALFVQTNPSYCCPSLVTEAMADRIEEVTGVPIVTIEYDGTGGSKNDDVIPYLRYLRKRAM
jgi:predicted nucleotide-binding protein (sugar kinase/HSP70/actin superfamily)